MTTQNPSRRTFLAAGASIPLAALPLSASAQAWPPATVKIIVPYPPGSEPDVLARDIAAQLGRRSGKTFVVDNKPGANTIVGTQELLKAEGDGSAMMLIDRLAVVTNPMLYARLPYVWQESIKPVSDLAKVNLFLAARQGFAAQNYRELIAYARQNPGKINVGTGGNGHVTHIAAAMIAQAEGVQFTYVPYRGIAPAVAAIVGGEIDLLLAGGLVLQPHQAVGKIRILAVGDDTRAGFLPEVPTIAEAGGRRDSIPSTVFGLLTTAKVPDAGVAQMRQAVADIVGQAEFRKPYESRGLVMGTTTPAQTLALMQQESAHYERVLKATGIKLE